MFIVMRSEVRRAAAIGAALLACLSTAACDDDTISPPDPVLWEAELEGDVIEGIADVSAGATSFTASVEIANGEEDAVLTWRIAAGTCEQPGARVGGADRYPELEVAADGTAEAEATVTAVLDEEEDYIAAVLDETGDEDVYVACGALTLAE